MSSNLTAPIFLSVFHPAVHIHDRQISHTNSERRQRPGYEPGQELLNFFTENLDGKGDDILTDLLMGR